MGIIIFCVLSVAACIFLIYALIHFHNELMRLGTKSTGHSLTYLGSYESDQLLQESAFSPSREQQPPGRA